MCALYEPGNPFGLTTGSGGSAANGAASVLLEWTLIHAGCYKIMGSSHNHGKVVRNKTFSQSDET